MNNNLRCTSTKQTYVLSLTSLTKQSTTYTYTDYEKKKKVLVLMFPMRNNHNNLERIQQNK